MKKKKLSTLIGLALAAATLAACGADTAEQACRDGNHGSVRPGSEKKEADGVEAICEDGTQVENEDVDGIGWQEDSP